MLFDKFEKLENEVHQALRDKITKGEYVSDHGDFPAMPIDGGAFEEIAIVDSKLILIDCDGQYFDIYHLPFEDVVELADKRFFMLLDERGIPMATGCNDDWDGFHYSVCQLLAPQVCNPDFSSIRVMNETEFVNYLRGAGYGVVVSEYPHKNLDQ